MSKKTLITIAAILGVLAVIFAVMFFVRNCDVNTANENKTKIDELNAEYVGLQEECTAAIEKLEGFIPTVEEAAASVEAAVEEKVEEVTGTVEEKVDEAVETVEEKVEEVTETVEEKVDEAVETVEEKVEEVTETVEEKADEAVEAVEEKTEEVIGTVEEKVDEVVEAVEEKADEVTETVEEVADAVEEGFNIEGITSAADITAEKLAELGWTVVEDGTVTEELQAKFDAAFANGFAGASYTADKLIATKTLEDGTVLYLFEGTQTYVIPDAVPAEGYTFIAEKADTTVEFRDFFAKEIAE